MLASVPSSQCLLPVCYSDSVLFSRPFCCQLGPCAGALILHALPLWCLAFCRVYPLFCPLGCLVFCHSLQQTSAPTLTALGCSLCPCSLSFLSFPPLSQCLSALLHSFAPLPQARLQGAHVHPGLLARVCSSLPGSWCACTAGDCPFCPFSYRLSPSFSFIGALSL